MVDVAVPDDWNIVMTKAWKIERYQGFAFEVQRIHRVKVVVVPLVIGVLRTVSKDCEVAGVPRYNEYKWMCPDVSLVGNSTYSQKGVVSVSCRRELRCDIEYQERIKSRRESHHHHPNNNNNNNNNNM